MIAAIRLLRAQMSSHLIPKTQEEPVRGELAASDRIVDVTSIARVQRFVNRTLRDFEGGRVQEAPLLFTVSDDVESNHGSLKIGYCQLGD